MTTEHTALCPARGWSACDCDWEARIRADERERSTPVFVASVPVIVAMVDLRAKVEALLETAKHVARTHEAEGAATPALQDRAAAFAYATVLTLFDGSRDD